MTKERYESLALQNLTEIAKNRGMKKISTLKKAELIEALLKKDEEDAAQLAAQNGGRMPKTDQKKPDAPIVHKNEFASELDSGQIANGILEVMPDGTQYWYNAKSGTFGNRARLVTQLSDGTICENYILDESDYTYWDIKQ